MNESKRDDNSFWSAESPLASLACTGLLVVASGRLAFALVAGTSLVLVYLATILALRTGRPLLTDRIRGAVSVLAASFFASVFLLLLSLLSPILAEESAFYLALGPVVFVASGMAGRCARDSLSASAIRSAAESLSILALLIGFALIREPLAYGALSLPGKDGLAVIVGSGEVSPFALRAASSTIGGLILAAYAIFAFRALRERLSDRGVEREDS